MAVPVDFLTFKQDVRPYGNGTVKHYPPDFSGTSPLNQGVLSDLAQGELVGYNRFANGGQLISPPFPPGTGGFGGLQRWLRDAGTPTDTQVFVGISRDSMNTGNSLGSVVGQRSFEVNGVAVWTSGVHMLRGKPAEVWHHGDAVYADINYVAGSGAVRRVTNVATGRVQIGTCYLLPADRNRPIFGDVIGFITIGGDIQRVPVLIDGFTGPTA